MGSPTRTVDSAKEAISWHVRKHAPGSAVVGLLRPDRARQGAETIRWRWKLHGSSSSISYHCGVAFQLRLPRRLSQLPAAGSTHLFRFLNVDAVKHFPLKDRKS